MNKIGILLNNIGSPSSTDPEDVGTYLKEFLMDKYIIEIPFLLRYILVHWIIVPRRKFSSALKYKKIWGEKKSPLIEISEQFCQKLQNELGGAYFVRLGMVNGAPSIESTLIEMREAGVEKIIFVPLYPQYARATSYAAEEKARKALAKIFKEEIPFFVLQPFYNSKAFILGSAEKLKQDWQSGKWQHLLFSFHGLPESQIKRNPGCLESSTCCDRAEACQMNCYRAQSLKTAELIAKEAGLTKDQYTICFQSRLGRAKWIGPATTDVAKKLAASGCKNLLVQTPSFVADCLETLEEIGLELKEDFIQDGGDNLKLVPCLNQDSSWVKDFAGLVRAAP